MSPYDHLPPELLATVMTHAHGISTDKGFQIITTQCLACNAAVSLRARARAVDSEDALEFLYRWASEHRAETGHNDLESWFDAIGYDE